MESDTCYNNSFEITSNSVDCSNEFVREFGINGPRETSSRLTPKPRCDNDGRAFNTVSPRTNPTSRPLLRVFVCHVVSRGDTGAAYTGVAMATTTCVAWWERETNELLRHKTPGRSRAAPRSLGTHKIATCISKYG